TADREKLSLAVRRAPFAVFRRPFPANHLGAIRSIRDGIGARRTFATLSAQIFFHKSFGMLNALPRQFSWPTSGRASVSTCADAKKSQRSKTLILSVFSASRKNFRRASCILAVQRVARAVCVGQTQDVVAPRECVCSIKRKCWCFCSAVVIGRAVFAIPAGTVRHRHSLMARRAAWRRSEGK